MARAEDPENPLLTLGIGCSACFSDNSKVSSATACMMSPLVKEIGESSMDFELRLGNGTAHCQKKFSVGAENVLLANAPKLDLQLSLSTGSPESTVTNPCTASPNVQDGLGTAVTNSAPAITGKGPEPSNWIFGHPMAASSYASEAIYAFSFPKIPKTVNAAMLSPDVSSTMIISVKSPAACTSGVTNPQQRKSNTKHCEFPGCVKGARGASGRCIAHGGGRRCQKPGCQKGAEGRTVFCKAHGGGRRCQFLGCTKSAEGRTEHCIAHGGGFRCSHEGCSRAARGKSGLCIKHGGGKRCQMENCTKSAEGYSGLCIAHGGGRRCQFPDCTKGAQGSTKLCKAHGGGKRCTFLGCTKGAEGSTAFCKGHGGGKRCSFQGGGICSKSVHGATQFCVAHGGGKRCTIPGCTRSARGRTEHCVRHGGGKRCRFAGCGKSAQGSTDFCKAHGGGKRCSWSLGAGAPPCDKFARTNTGLCAAHSALVEDRRVHGGATLDPEAGQFATYAKPDEASRNEEAWLGWSSSPVPAHSTLDSCLEGRVHGVGMFALLSGNGSHGNAGSSDNASPDASFMRAWM